METWRFLISVCVILLVWAGVVTVLSSPPGPLAVIGVTVFAAVSLFLSDRLMGRLTE